MAPRPRKHETESDRQRAFTERQQEAGKLRRCFWLSEEAVAKLKKLAKRERETLSNAVEGMIMKWPGK